MDFDNTWVKIDLSAIEANIDAVAAKANVPVMAVIKADAYGHGAVPIARLLEKKCAFFGVSSMLEAMELRSAGIRLPILILGATPDDAYPLAVREDIRPAIFTWESACALSRAAAAQGKTVRLHFAADTGMSRIGLQVTEEAADLCARIAALPGLVCEGLFSHFATADETDLTRARAQAARFADFDAMLKARGLEIPIRHLNNSAGVMNFSEHYDMVRSGIVTYGLYPSSEVDPGDLPLRPALSWYSRVTHVKTLPAGREISYGGPCVTTRDTRVATVAVGYADGYRRSLSGRFYVLIRGRKAPILGRVCMDQLMVDVTDVPGVCAGDEVMFLGGDIGINEYAGWGRLNRNEALGRFGRRVTRVYRWKGREFFSNDILRLLDHGKS